MTIFLMVLPLYAYLNLASARSVSYVILTSYAMRFLDGCISLTCRWTKHVRMVPYPSQSLTGDSAGIHFSAFVAVVSGMVSDAWAYYCIQHILLGTLLGSVAGCASCALFPGSYCDLSFVGMAYYGIGLAGRRCLPFTFANLSIRLYSSCRITAGLRLAGEGQTALYLYHGSCKAAGRARFWFVVPCRNKQAGDCCLDIAEDSLQVCVYWLQTTLPPHVRGSRGSRAAVSAHRLPRHGALHPYLLWRPWQACACSFT